jgi:LytS/YehU family sensor histidine kinase
MLDSRLVAFTAGISAVTAVLSALTVPFLLGTGVHFFQVGIMLAGVVGGPMSGLITGLIGGLYVALIRSDPTIVIGNGLLGLFTALFSRRLRPVLAGLVAWILVQAPWVYLTGTFVYRVPSVAMQLILVLLTVENMICASIVDVLTKHSQLGEILLAKVKSR